MKKKKSRAKKPQREFSFPLTNIKVVGVGGGGNSAVSRMSRNFMRGVEFIAINADHQDLDYCDVRKKIYIGKNLTKGLGTGMNPDLGRQAAEENRAEIAESLQGADIVFLTAGFGGGTGSGGLPVVAEVAKQSGALTLAFVTKPFAFEGSQRQRIAEEAIGRLRDKVDAMIVVPNDRIFTVISKDTPILKAFEAIDEVLKNALQGIVELIVTPGIINIDYADVRAVIQDAGSAIVGVGIASGPERAVTAVGQAMNSPLLEVNPEGAHGVLLGIAGGRDLRMTEINEAAKIVAQAVDPGARIIFGAYYDKNLKAGAIKVTLIATGFNASGSTNSLFNNTFLGEAKKEVFSPKPPAEFPSRAEDRVRPSSERERQIDELLPKNQSSTPVLDPMHDAKSERMKQNPQPSRKNDSDVWDIPTFLRRRKK